jgi:putative transposase
MAAAGHRLGLKRVWRLMRAAGLRGRHPKAWKRTTLAGDRPVSAPDLIGRRFTAQQPDQKWCGDVTYVKTWDGWAYLATVIDLHSRRVVGWAVADHMRTSLVTDALEMAIKRRRPPAGVVFHSDRGATYTSGEFDAYCQRNSIRRSLGRTGICYDNAVAESFFATYKKELIHTRPWLDVKDLTARTEDWIENYYNTTRRHSTLGYLTPRTRLPRDQSTGSLIRRPKKREHSTAPPALSPRPGLTRLVRAGAHFTTSCGLTQG